MVFIKACDISNADTSNNMPCVFCDFVSKKKTENHGYPVIFLKEAKNTVSFLSIDFPEKEDGHVLVIPKKHFPSLEDIPINIEHELIEHVSAISKVLRKTHKGCNVLLNDGRAAGQRVNHTHFHIIPRDKGDKIKIELWKKKKMSVDQFKKLHAKIRKEIEKV